MLLSNIIAPILLAISAAAAPLDSSESSLATRTIIPKVPKILVVHAAAAMKAYCPDPTKTMMHSGIGAGVAAKLARKRHLMTVEATIEEAVSYDRKGRNIYKETLQKYNVPKHVYVARGGKLSDWKAAWGAISDTWATYAQEQTTLATHKAGPSPESFYKTREEPILKYRHIKITVDDTQAAVKSDY